MAGAERGASGTPALSSAPRATHQGSQWLASAVDGSWDPGGVCSPLLCAREEAADPTPSLPLRPLPSLGHIGRVIFFFLLIFFLTLITDVMCPFLGYIISFGLSGFKTH